MSNAIRERETELWHMREALKKYESEIADLKDEVIRLTGAGFAEGNPETVAMIIDDLKQATTERDSLRRLCRDAAEILVLNGLTATAKALIESVEDAARISAAVEGKT